MGFPGVVPTQIVDGVDAFERVQVVYSLAGKVVIRTKEDSARFTDAQLAVHDLSIGLV
jgi:hypothetical protein